VACVEPSDRGDRTQPPGDTGPGRRPAVTGGQYCAQTPLQADRPGVSGANQYRVKPWPLVSTVVQPIMVVFSTAPVWPAGGPAGRAARTRHRHAEQH
jgi:hypothetical protein